MKIESAAAYRYYKSYAATGSTAAQSEPSVQLRAEGAAKTDQVSFSGKASGQSGLGRLAQSIAAELSTGTPASRLEELRQAAENDEYYVPTGMLADAMLNVLG